MANNTFDGSFSAETSAAGTTWGVSSDSNDLITSVTEGVVSAKEETATIPAHAAEAASAAGGACGHRLRLRLRGRHVRNAPAAVRSPDRAAGGLFAVRLLHEKLCPRYIAGLPGHVDGRV